MTLLKVPVLICSQSFSMPGSIDTEEMKNCHILIREFSEEETIFILYSGVLTKWNTPEKKCLQNLLIFMFN